MEHLTYAFVAIAVTLVVLFVLRLMIAVRRFKLEQPENERNWVNDNAKLTRAQFDGNVVRLENVRDFTWRSTQDFDERWVEREVRLDQVSKVWLILEYFEPDKPQIAHTFLSFEFEDGQRLACSIEVRREQGERFHPLKGLGRSFELMYVWATEADAIGVRARCRTRSITHLLEGRVLREESKPALFESYLKRTNALAEKPEWYNTITNTCTTNLVQHINDIYPGRVPMGLAWLLPGLSPEMMERERLIHIEEDLPTTMDRSRIDERALDWDGECDFGDWVRSA
ncbi:MAG: DUF4105 domain-containing protein [Candidatus Poseidoniales archaeon]|nr:MAG: DUF4105 domain-containing protein [Candidatus Poseidoniales archaeon]